MDFSFSEEQEMLRRESRRFLAERWPGAGEWDRSAWKEIAALGWTGISVPESEGGAGLGFLEEAVLFEEIGWARFPGPYFATVGLALPALSPEQQRLVAGGERTYSLAVPGWPVPEDDLVDEVVTLEAGPRAEKVRSRALAALALEAAGIAGRVLEFGVEHASSRQQFGKPIGSFQAVSHKLADTYLECELARSIAYWAAWSVSQSDTEAALAAAAAKSYAADAAVAACERSIQVHGGIGFTWEHVLHRYYKRAMWIQAFAGYASAQRSVVARALLD
jgi:alkylation response protein AidB-like acyl-CoA dehydrogenase